MKLLLFCLALACAHLSAAQTRLGDWQLSSPSFSDTLPAKVPGTVYESLMAGGKLPPYTHPALEAQWQWADTLSWWYHSRFELTEARLADSGLALHFDRIDTDARIYLNGQLLGRTGNVFHSHQFLLGKAALAGSNMLQVEIRPIQATNDSLRLSYPQALPESHRVFVRTPAWHFGWDWGPKLMAGGITGEVRLVETKQQTEIKHWHFRTMRLEDTVAVLRVSVEVKQPQSGGQMVLLLGDGQRYVTKAVDLEPTDSLLEADLYIPNPKLWWPNGAGEAFLHHLEAYVLQGDVVVQRYEHKVGIRTVELVQEADDFGRSFFFLVNNRPLYIKGINYIPRSRLVNDDVALPDSNLLQLAQKAHMNLIRVWGGGDYASDAFMESADRLGLLVWQDFAFACAMYPGDSAFVASVRREATEQLLRLRKYTSLALWCGNNENYEGWFNWGWQKQLGHSPADSLAVLQAYQQLFQRELPALVRQYDPDRSYTHSSPLNGWGRERAYQEGDVHYWGVWWGRDSLETYRRKTGRFVSEYGMQALPVWRSLQQMTGEDRPGLQSLALRTKQKHPTGFETLNTYLERDFGKFDSLAAYAYATQLLQVRALQIAIEAHRLQEKCMGTLPWQFNDAWPGISWSVVDYYGRPKAGYYALQHLYAPILPVLQATATELELLVTSDLVADSSATVLVELWKPGGWMRKGGRRFGVRLSAGRTTAVISLPGKWQKQLLGGKAVLFVQVQGAATGRFLSPLRPKELQWPAASVRIKQKGDQITVRTRRAVSQLYVDAETPLDLNYLDVRPRWNITLKPFISHEKTDFNTFSFWHQHLLGPKP